MYASELLAKLEAVRRVTPAVESVTYDVLDRLLTLPDTNNRTIAVGCDGIGKRESTAFIAGNATPALATRGSRWQAIPLLFQKLFRNGDFTEVAAG